MRKKENSLPISHIDLDFGTPLILDDIIVSFSRTSLGLAASALQQIAFQCLQLSLRDLFFVEVIFFKSIWNIQKYRHFS